MYLYPARYAVYLRLNTILVFWLSRLKGVLCVSARLPQIV